MKTLVLALSLLGLISCSNHEAIKVSDTNINPGSEVNIHGKPHSLSQGSIEVGENFLRKTQDTEIDFKFNNKVTIVNVVPSIDTVVCEEQTHLLGDAKGLNNIDLAVVSRDLPMAQARFAKAAKLENINYYSDYKSGKFGSSLGLMIKGPELLTRGVLVLDKDANIRYMQFVDEITELPNMEKAFEQAKKLASS